MKARVLVTGATGFTGSYVVPLLLRRDYRVRCLVRKSSDTGALAGREAELAYGDLGDLASLDNALREIDVLVNIASLGFGHAPNIVNSAVAAGVRRAVFIGTTAVNTTLNASSKSVRLAAEDAIRRSGLAYTILRPTMIYGSRRDRNICRLLKHLSRWPLIPVFGDGEHLQQPVYVGDVASAVVQSLESDAAIGKTYHVSGANPVTYNQLIDQACALMGRKVRRLYLPATPAVAALAALERLSLRLPIKSEQIQRLNEDKAFDYQEASRDFNYSPRTLSEGLRLELEDMHLLPATPIDATGAVS
jgi:uncharacterized protein YbjT (DUF2867 family)